MHTSSLTGRLFLLAISAAACRTDRPADGTAQAAAAPPATAAPTAAPASEVVHVVTRDYKFELPATIPAGAVTFHMMNEGKELHHAQVVRLDEGKTAADLKQALAHPGPPPAWAHFLGGPNGSAPGAAAQASAVLAPGHYALICFIPDAKGVPHFAKGMVQPFEVTGAATASALPAASDTIHVNDYDFVPGRPLEAGNHTVLVLNDGPQPHELVMLKLAPGKSVKDFMGWVGAGMQGAPPGMPVGGVAVLDQGATATFTADLAAGDYAFICFVPDAKDGKEHAQHGMAKQFRIG